MRLDTVPITGSISIQVTEEELGTALARLILAKVGIDDDAGTNWFTDADRNSYFGAKDWKVSSIPRIAALVDAYNVLSNGQVLTDKEMGY